MFVAFIYQCQPFLVLLFGSRLFRPNLFFCVLSNSDGALLYLVTALCFGLLLVFSRTIFFLFVHSTPSPPACLFCWSPFSILSLLSWNCQFATNACCARYVLFVTEVFLCHWVSDDSFSFMFSIACTYVGGLVWWSSCTFCCWSKSGSFTHISFVSSPAVLRQVHDSTCSYGFWYALLYYIFVCSLLSHHCCILCAGFMTNR